VEAQTSMSQFNTQVLPAQSKGDFDRAVDLAAAQLRLGEVVGVPTETVYGLAGNALSGAAVRKIFDIKGRPQSNPLIVHVADWAMVEQCTYEWDAVAKQLAKAFWPGPLTIVVRRSDLIPNEVTAGGETVAIRWPSHPIMQAVIKAAGFPLAAPSANLSNALSPTQAHHVVSQLNGAIPLVVDGGHAAVGIESTVVDLVHRPARILRPGMVQRAALEAACDSLAWESQGGPKTESDVSRSPGLLKQHYSPRARLMMVSWASQENLEDVVRATGLNRAMISVMTYDQIPDGAGFARVSVIPDDAEAYARALFSELHLCDEAGSELILVEALPESAEWDGIRDRLQRASAKGSG
jgi:L-threonylcarbamoyladenylate synthase